MRTYTVEVPDDEPERGIRIRCEEHDQAEEFQPGYRSVAFACDDCGYELEVAVHDLLDWRDTGELC